MPTATIEHRFAELRALAEGSRVLEGDAVVYGDEARIGRARERIEPGAFAPLRELVYLVVQHARGEPIARRGRGLALQDGPDRLAMRAELPATPRADQALADVREGLLTGLSVEMVVREEEWAGDLRIIRRADLVRLSLVDVPAYGRSEVVARERALHAEERRRWWL